MTAALPDTDARTGEPLNTRAPNQRPPRSPTRNWTPQTPTSACGYHLPTPTRADPEPHPTGDLPARPTAPVPPGDCPAPAPTPAPAPAQATAPNVGATAGALRHGPQPTMPQPQGPTLAQAVAGTGCLATTTGPADATDRADTENRARPSHAAQRPMRRHGPQTAQIHHPHDRPIHSGGAPSRT